MGASFICEQMVFKNINLEFGYTAAISCTENKYVNRMNSFKRFFFSYSIILTGVTKFDRPIFLGRLCRLEQTPF